MNWNYFYNLIKNEHPVLSFNDLKIITQGKISSIQLSRWTAKKLLFKLRRGIYILPENINTHAFVLANKVFEPSYVSLESALYYYNLIPDVVAAVTSVTSRRTCQFEFNQHNFIYQKLKPSLFFGYQEIKDKDWGFLIALPEKAMLDYFYLHQPALKNSDAWQELRINQEMYVQQVNKAKLLKLSRVFDSQKLTTLIQAFDKYIRAN